MNDPHSPNADDLKALIDSLASKPLIRFQTLTKDDFTKIRRNKMLALFLDEEQHAQPISGAPMQVPDFPIDLLDQATSKAASLGLPLRQYIIEALEEKIARTP
jgi:hypothetical protein